MVPHSVRVTVGPVGSALPLAFPGASDFFDFDAPGRALTAKVGYQRLQLAVTFSVNGCV